MYISKSILVVDDDPIILDLIVRLMRRMGFGRIVTAQHGNLALELLKRNSPEIGMILLDTSLPEPNGMELARMIRQDLRLSQPLIALTTRSESKIQEHLRQAGFDMVLDKPFDLMHLQRTLKR